jgi:NTP-dependent ternary system trypsin peptidase co-occuring protein
MAIVEITDVQGSVPIRIEVAEAEDVRDFYADRETRGIVTRQVTAMARQLYTEAIGLAGSCAAQTRQQLDAMAEKDRPDEFEVTFAINVDAVVGAKIVNLDSGAQVQVRMQWNRGTGG